MKRSIFFKALFGLPFSGKLAKHFKSESGKPKYMLNKFYVAGFQYYGGPSLINDIAEGEFLNLQSAPSNEYDRFALEVKRVDETMLGHVPRTDNRHISRLLRQNVSLYCKVTEVNPENEIWKMLRVEIWL